MYRQSQRGGATRKTCRRLAWAAALLGLCGCASSGRTKGAGEMRHALDDYQAHRYEQARGRAEDVRHAGGPMAGQAAYLQGLSAYQLGADDEASHALAEAAAKSSGPDAGRARAALGLVAMRQGRNADAAASFRAAARDLSGEDGRLAAAWATRAGTSGGQPAASVAAGVFTIQVGAFRGRPRAESAARTAQPVAERCGVAPVRIVQRSDDRGETLFVVQMGRFDSRDEAADARRRVGNLQYIIAALGG